MHSRQYAHKGGRPQENRNPSGTAYKLVGSTKAAMSKDSSGKAAVTPEKLKSMLQEFSRAGKNCSDGGEVRLAHKLCELLKRHLKDKCLAMVEDCRNQPLLISYSSDATSLLCRTVHRAQIGDTPIRRAGKDLYELLMQRAFFKSFGLDGEERVEILYWDPVPLTAGKKSCPRWSP